MQGVGHSDLEVGSKQNPRARVPQSCTCIKCDCVDATFPFKNPDIGWHMADHKVAVTSEFVRIKLNKK